MQDIAKLPVVKALVEALKIVKNSTEWSCMINEEQDAVDSALTPFTEASND